VEQTAGPEGQQGREVFAINFLNCTDEVDDLEVQVTYFDKVTFHFSEEVNFHRTHAWRIPESTRNLLTRSNISGTNVWHSH
jgi:hypothetical protein